MTKTDPLIIGAIKATEKCPGSFKTKYNHRKEALRFIKTLRSLNFGVKHWKNINNKHVQAVVDVWKAEGKSVATIKEYLSGVRICSNFWNDNPEKSKISNRNSDFGIGNRVYISNLDKSLPEHVYNKAVSILQNSVDPHHHRVAATLKLSRELGLRKEEAFKFTSKHLLQDGRIIVSAGTKGGRERVLFNVSEKGREALEYQKKVSGKNNQIPQGWTERQWEGKYYRELARIGLSKKDCGSSTHGLRHAYAQERYKEITGFECRVKYGSKEEFLRSVHNIENWKQLDRDARLILKAELGHGPDRNEVISQYIGSHHR